MTQREVDMLRQYLGDEIKQLRDDLRRSRLEASDDHSLVRADLRNLSSRIEALEDRDQIEESRRRFRQELTKRIITINAVVIATGGFALAVIDHLT